MNGNGDEVSVAAKPTLLIVCTGNECRSPAAEFLLVQALGSAAGRFRILSAGTSAAVGVPVDPVIGDLLRDRGIDASAFRSRRLERRMLESAHLILTATSDHAAAAGRILPTIVRRTVTLKRLARFAPFILEAGPPPERAADRVPWIRAAIPLARARAAETRTGTDDLADPKGGSRRAYGAAFADVERACAAIAPLFGSGLADHPGSPDSSEHGRLYIPAALSRPAPGRAPDPADSRQRQGSFFDWAFPS